MIAVGIAVETEIGPNVVLLVSETRDGPVVDHVRQIHNVEQVGAPLADWQRVGNGTGQRRVVRGARIKLARFLFRAAAGAARYDGHDPAGFVERAVRVETDARELVLA